MIKIISMLAALSLVACGQSATSDPQSPATSTAPETPTLNSGGSGGASVYAGGDLYSGSADIVGVEGTTIGQATVTDGPNGVLLRIELEAGSLSPGWHGLHLHAVGDCSDTGVFKASGGHVGKVAGGHGLLNPAGPEGGDIPNIYAHADGSAGYEAFTNLTSGEDLLDEDGSAIIIHANPDDHLTQPIGGAGGRVACGVIG